MTTEPSDSRSTRYASDLANGRGFASSVDGRLYVLAKFEFEPSDTDLIQARERRTDRVDADRAKDNQSDYRPDHVWDESNQRIPRKIVPSGFHRYFELCHNAT